MPCYHPVAMGRNNKIAPFRRPCGNCTGCRHEYARQAAVRCYQESTLHDRNCFITLTYDEKHVNPKGTLVKKDFQLFLKRLRKHYFGNTKSDVRYYMCGEYGTQNDRPHFHSILFNFDFPDKQPYKKNKNGDMLYRSKILEKLWSDPDTGESYGFSSIGAVSYASAVYVAQYCLKKINGKMAPDHYKGRLPEFTLSSRRSGFTEKKGGIGYDWYLKYHKTDLYNRDYAVVNGTKGKIPKYYDTKYKLTNPEEFAQIKSMRKTKAETNPNNNPYRLIDAEKIQKAKNAIYANRSI